MTIEVSIALITSIASIIVAITTSIINTKVLAKRNEDIEKLKFDLERKKINYQIPETHTIKRLAALDKHISAIQGIKDLLLTFCQGPENSLLASIGFRQYKEARDKIFECYRNDSADMEREENDKAHKAKNLVYSGENLIAGAVKNKEYLSFNEEEKDRIVSLKNQLTDLQNSLRDIKYSIITKYL